MSSVPPNAEALAAHAFKPGQSGNPGGRPVAARNKLQTKFLKELADDFEAHGKEAIEDCREQKPDKYLAVIASLMPKEVEITRPLDELTDEQLDAAIATVRALATAADAGASEGAAQGVQPAAGLSAVREAG